MEVPAPHDAGRRVPELKNLWFADYGTSKVGKITA